MSDNFNSNTGSIGREIRSDERLYDNVEVPYERSDEVLARFEANIQETERAELTRTVDRQIVDINQLGDIHNSEHGADLEVVLPLTEFTHTNGRRLRGALVYLGHNQPGREPLRPAAQMAQDVAASIRWRGQNTLGSQSPAERLQTVRRNGFTFSRLLDHEDILPVTGLWDATFRGWSLESGTVINLRERLLSEQEIDPRKRSVWFSAIKRGGAIVSLSMAERITFETDGGPQDFVESTEWLTSDSAEIRGHHLMAAALVALNAQVAHDLARGPHGVPVIYAECNDKTNAYRAGFASGLRVPYRSATMRPAPQILRQNVSVYDGVVTGRDDNLRDFHFMYMPRGVHNTMYGQSQTAGILRAAGLGE